MTATTYEVNGYPVEVIEQTAVWNSEKNYYEHNYEKWTGEGFWSMGPLYSTGNSFSTLAAAKRSLRSQTKERAGWEPNQHFVIVVLHFVGRPLHHDQDNVGLYASTNRKGSKV